MAITAKDGTTTYEGAVLATRWSRFSDYDVHVADVWDGSEIKTVSADFGIDAKIDATPEVLEAVLAWETERGIGWLRHEETRRWLERAEAACEIGRGTRVRVARGRKIPIGTEGEVFWTGHGTWGERAGIRGDDGETYWTAITNLDAILDPDDIPALDPATDDEMRARARANAERTWRTPVAA
jgi:hypothetical protein